MKEGRVQIPGERYSREREWSVLKLRARMGGVLGNPCSGMENGECWRLIGPCFPNRQSLWIAWGLVKDAGSDLVSLRWGLGRGC